MQESEGFQLVVCIDDSCSNTLAKGTVYYAFSHTDSAYYISHFPRKGSHFGAFQRERFEGFVENESPSAEAINNRIIYQANYIGECRHYKRALIFIGDTYGPYKTASSVYVYADAEGKKVLGRASKKDFVNLREPVMDTQFDVGVKVAILPPEPAEKFEQLVLMI